MGSKRNGLLALLGLGAVAYWKYRKSTPEEKQKVKDTLNTVKDNLSKYGNDVKSKVNEGLDDAKNVVRKTVDDVREKADEVKTDIENAATK